MAITYRSSLSDAVTGNITLDSLTITTSATKQTYFRGESLDISDLVVTAVAGKLSADVTSHCFIYPQILDSDGTQTISIEYGGLKTSYNVTVGAIGSIEIVKQPYQTQFVKNSLMDLDGIKVVAHVGNETVDVTKLCTYKPTNGTKLRTVGSFTLEVSYYGKTVVTYYSVVPPTTLTVCLDTTNSDPDTWGTYEDDAVEMTLGSNAFEEFFGCYPCILEDGKELGRLNPNNFAQYDDNTSAPITTFGKDVMMYYPKRGLRIWHEGTDLKVSITNEPDKENYRYDAFTYMYNELDGFYIGVYKAYINEEKAYSVSGQSYTQYNENNKSTFAEARSYTEARGDNYEVCNYFQYQYIRAMFMLKFRGKSQWATVGTGFSGNNGHECESHTRGEANTLGITGGTAESVKRPTKIFGLENLGAFYPEFMEGIKFSAGTFHYAEGTCRYSYETGYTDIPYTINGGNTGGGYKDVYGGLVGFLASTYADISDTVRWPNYFCAHCGGYSNGAYYYLIGQQDTATSPYRSPIMACMKSNTNSSLHDLFRISYARIKKSRSRDDM